MRISSTPRTQNAANAGPPTSWRILKFSQLGKFGSSHECAARWVMAEQKAVMQTILGCHRDDLMLVLQAKTQLRGARIDDINDDDGSNDDDCVDSFIFENEKNNFIVMALVLLWGMNRNISVVIFRSQGRLDSQVAYNVLEQCNKLELRRFR